jgi:hypothetical protein
MTENLEKPYETKEKQNEILGAIFSNSSNVFDVVKDPFIEYGFTILTENNIDVFIDTLILEGKGRKEVTENGKKKYFIITEEGEQEVEIGNVVMKGVADEYWSLKDIEEFKRKYYTKEIDFENGKISGVVKPIIENQTRKALSCKYLKPSTGEIFAWGQIKLAYNPNCFIISYGRKDYGIIQPNIFCFSYLIVKRDLIENDLKYYKIICTDTNTENYQIGEDMTTIMNEEKARREQENPSTGGRRRRRSKKTMRKRRKSHCRRRSKKSMRR